MGCSVSQASLYSQLHAVREQLAQAAQRVYDEWKQDETGWDDTVGQGGICDRIAETMGNVLDWGVPEAEVEDLYDWEIHHVALFVTLGNEACIVDIPPYVYETGAGYVWKKIPGVVFRPWDVVIEKVANR